MIRVFVLVGLMAALPSLVQAEDKVPSLRERINCFPAKKITKFVSKFENMDAEKRDIVDMRFEAKFEVKDGGVLPERIFMRDNGTEIDFTLKADGAVPDFKKIGRASDGAELCSEDPSREGTSRGEGLSFSIENDVYFLDNSGYHTLEAMKEGLKDGKSHYKKMVPAPMRMIIPKLSYVMIEYDAENTTPQYSAMRGDAPIEGLTHETFCNTAMIKIKDLEALGGDGLKVMGGPYNLTPVPGPKTLAKFAGCSDDEEAGEEKE